MNGSFICVNSYVDGLSPTRWKIGENIKFEVGFLKILSLRLIFWERVFNEGYWDNNCMKGKKITCETTLKDSNDDNYWKS